MPLIAKALDSTQFVSENLPAGSSTLVAGVTAGVIGSTLSHPFDTIKVRLSPVFSRQAEILRLILWAYIEKNEEIWGSLVRWHAGTHASIHRQRPPPAQ